MAKKRAYKGDLYNKKLVTIVLVVFIILILYFYVLKKTCYDETCFNERLAKCLPVDYIKRSNNNVYLYSINAFSLQNYVSKQCTMKITFESAAPGSDVDIIQLLEGKSMSCRFEKGFLDEVRELSEVDNILTYCHGELKEGMYELIIKRMYAVIIGNLDGIDKAVQEGIG